MQKEKIMTLKEDIQKDGRRYLCVKSAIISGTTQYLEGRKFFFFNLRKYFCESHFAFTMQTLISLLQREKSN